MNQSTSRAKTTTGGAPQHDGDGPRNNHEDEDEESGSSGPAAGVNMAGRPRRSPEAGLMRQWLAASLKMGHCTSFEALAKDKSRTTTIVQVLDIERRNIIVTGLPEPEHGAHELSCKPLDILRPSGELTKTTEHERFVHFDPVILDILARQARITRSRIR